LIRDMNKCVLCRRWRAHLHRPAGVGVLEAVDRGDATRIATFLDKRWPR